ncbi:uncharacterized protein METZ01_LOCUS424570, partial [marine metagenome]
LASDGALESNAGSVSITIVAVNDVPVVSNLTSSVLEDSSVVVLLLGTDIDGDALTYAVSSTASNGAVLISGDTAIYTPSTNYNGSDSFTYLASDGALESNAGSVSITIAAVNDAPVVSDITSQSVDEDNVFTYTVEALDIDGDDLLYFADADANSLVTIADNLLTVIPDADFNGDIVVTVTVSDGQYSDSDEFTLTVNAVNDAPVVSDPIEDFQLLEDSEAATIDLGTVFTDVDNVGLVYSSSLSSDGIITAEIDGSMLTLTTLPDQNG